MCLGDGYLGESEAFMIEQLMRRLTPSGTDIKLQLKPLDGMSTVKMGFRDNVDIQYDQKVCACRRRIEWPANDALIRDTVCQDSQSVTVSAEAVFGNEISRCDPRSDYVPDIAVFDQLDVWPSNWQGTPRNLYWRAQTSVDHL